MNKRACSRLIQTLIDFITVCIVSIIFLLIFLFLHPYERGFYCDDSSIRYPYKSVDTIPLWLAGLYGGLSAFFIIIFTELYVNRPCCIPEDKFRAKRNKCNTAIISALLIFLMGAMATLLITEIGKHTIGRLRPHFIDICQPKWDQLQCYEIKKDSTGKDISLPKYIKFSNEICNNYPAKEKQIREARLSFPSGHSSFTVYSMIFIIIYLEARVKSVRIRFIKSAIQLIAFIASWHTCMSRVSDFKHHHTDVIAGALIGFSVAIFCTLIMGKILWIYGLEDDDLLHQNKNLNSLKAIDETFNAPDQVVQ